MRKHNNYVYLKNPLGQMSFLLEQAINFSELATQEGSDAACDAESTLQQLRSLMEKYVAGTERLLGEPQNTKISIPAKDEELWEATIRANLKSDPTCQAEALRYLLVTGMIPYDQEIIDFMGEHINEVYLNGEQLPAEMKQEILKIAEVQEGAYHEDTETYHKKLLETTVEGAWISKGKIQSGKVARKYLAEITSTYSVGLYPATISPDVCDECGSEDANWIDEEDGTWKCGDCGHIQNGLLYEYLSEDEK